jgi:Na+-translocating ferredoxin:NAD+ oxidoreductase RnfD subunit
MTNDRNRAMTRSKWFLPSFSLLLGLVMLAASWLGGQPVTGATAAAGLALIVALIVAWLVAMARGRSGSPYGWLLAIGGLAYLLSVAWFRWRG